MMIDPISGNGQPELPQEAKFSQERFNMEWEMSLMGIYASVTGNRNAGHQLDRMKDELKKGGTSPDQLTAHVDQLTNALGLPPFDGSKNFVQSIGTVLKAAVGEEQTEAMMQALGDNPSINAVIDAANQLLLPTGHQLQKLGGAHLG